MIKGHVDNSERILLLLLLLLSLLLFTRYEVYVPFIN